jgi:hypothetical protein
MAQTYQQGHNIIVMALSRDAMQLMKSSVKTGQHFRALKQTLGPKLKKMRGEMKSLIPSIGGIRKRMDETRDEIKLLVDGKQTVGPKHLEYQAALITDYRAKVDEYQRLRERSERDILTLKKEEKRWVSQMRSVTDIHEKAFVDCGVEDDDEEPPWEDSAYIIDELESEPTFIGFDIDSSDSSEHETIVEAKTGDSEAIDMGKQHHDHEQDLQDAYAAHDDHRSEYDRGLQNHIRDQKRRRQNVSDNVLANKFTPIFLTEGQELIADVKAAEDALAKFEQKAWEAGAPLHTLGFHADAAAYEAAIEMEGRLDMTDYKCEKVEQWMNTEMDTISLADTIPDLPEEDVAGIEGIMRDNDEATEMHEPEVGDISNLNCTLFNRSRMEIKPQPPASLLPTTKSGITHHLNRIRAARLRRC